MAQQLSFERKVDDVDHPVAGGDIFGFQGHTRQLGHAHRRRVDNAVAGTGRGYNVLNGLYPIHSEAVLQARCQPRGPQRFNVEDQHATSFAFE